MARKHLVQIAAASGLAAITVLAGSGPGEALTSHRRRPVAVPAQPRPSSTYSFYPESIEGGVKGNLSFNNQIRKLSDPLNANGGR